MHYLMVLVSLFVAPHVVWADLITATYGQRSLMGTRVVLPNGPALLTCEGHLVPMPLAIKFGVERDAVCQLIKGSGVKAPITPIVWPEPPCGQPRGPRPNIQKYLVRYKTTFGAIEKTYRGMMARSAKRIGATIDWGDDSQQYFIRSQGHGSAAVVLDTRVRRGVDRYFDVYGIDAKGQEEPCEEEPKTPKPKTCPSCIEAIQKLVRTNKDWWVQWGNPESKPMARYYNEIGEYLGLKERALKVFVGDDLLFKQQLLVDIEKYWTKAK